MKYARLVSHEFLFNMLFVRLFSYLSMAFITFNFFHANFDLNFELKEAALVVVWELFSLC